MTAALKNQAVRTPFWTLPLVVLLGLGVLILRNPQRINHDCALYLQCGTLLMEGKLPYVDFVDINPPLIMYLSALPASLARMLSVGPILPFSLCVLALVAWSTLALQAQALASGAVSRPVVAALGCLWAGFSLLLWDMCEFGQREHLFLLLYLPFLIARWRRWNGGSVRPSVGGLLGVGAGVGLCLKPQLALGPVAVELYFALSERTLRPLASVEIAALLCTALVYALHFALLPQAVRDAFFHRWVPLISEGYSAYDAPRAWMQNATVAIALGVALVGFGTRWFCAGALGLLAGALAMLMLGSVAAYFLQGKGWFYQQIPALGAAVLVLAASAARCIERLGEQRRGMRGALTLFLGPLVVASGWLLFVGNPRVPYLQGDSGSWGRPFVPMIDTYSEAREPVLFISTSVVPAYPLLVQSNRVPGSRYLWFFPIALFAHIRSRNANGYVHYPSRSALPSAESRFIDDVAEDIATRRPPLIFVPPNAFCQGCPIGFNVMDYLVAVGLLDEIRRDYTRVQDTLGYAVFVRNDRIGGQRQKTG